MVSQNPWIMHSSKCLINSCSSSSGLEGAVLDTVQPAGVLLFRLVEASGVVWLAKSMIAGVRAGDSIGTSRTAGAELLVCCAVELSGISSLVGVGPLGLWWSLEDCQSKMSFSSSDERCNSSVSPGGTYGLADGIGWAAAE
ncbi:hypothetical protein V6N11_031257 [Hibiscus sabdariffa]|uniref:Uncharacterized protein n=1 Tax=Hibiscus sabdariffa TaxID=183260 RepID=A0ABR2SXY3_9ROSI